MQSDRILSGIKLFRYSSRNLYRTEARQIAWARTCAYVMGIVQQLQCHINDNERLDKDYPA